MRDRGLGMRRASQQGHNHTCCKHNRDAARDCTQPLADLPFNGLRLHKNHKF
jgi:hypothetical protein